MVDQQTELWSCTQTAEYLGITVNNLRQLQHRGQIRWKKRTGKRVYYDAAAVIALKTDRDSRGL